MGHDRWAMVGGRGMWAMEGMGHEGDGAWMGVW